MTFLLLKLIQTNNPNPMQNLISSENLPFEVAVESEHVMTIKRKTLEHNHRNNKKIENKIRVYLFDHQEAKRIMEIEPYLIKSEEKVSFRILKGILDFLKMT
jgi:hypothetical protein